MCVSCAERKKIREKNMERKKKEDSPRRLMALFSFVRQVAQRSNIQRQAPSSVFYLLPQFGSLLPFPIPSFTKPRFLMVRCPNRQSFLYTSSSSSVKRESSRDASAINHFAVVFQVFDFQPNEIS